MDNYLATFNAFCAGGFVPDDLATAITFTILKDLKARKGFKEVWESLGDSERGKILLMNVNRASAKITQAS